MQADIPQEAKDAIIDEEHLRLLAIGHYIAGGLCIAFASIFIFHFAFLVAMSVNPELFGPVHQGKAAPEAIMRIFAVVLGFFILGGWAFGGLTIYVGRCIKRRTRRTLTFVLACINTMMIPVGTVVGVCTLMVLSRPSVKRLYETG